MIVLDHREARNFYTIEERIIQEKKFADRYQIVLDLVRDEEVLTEQIIWGE